jgi:hypothetical protein
VFVCESKERASRQTQTQGNNITKKTAQKNKTNGKHAECDHVKKGSEPKKAAKQNPASI